MASTKDFFLERFVTSSHERSKATNCRQSDTMGYFPLQNLNYGSNCGAQTASSGLPITTNPAIWFNQSIQPFELKSDFNSNSISPAIPSFTSLILSAPAIDLPPDNPNHPCMNIGGVQFWEGGTSSASSRTSGSSNSTEFQSNTSFFDSSLFSWGLADCRVESSDISSDKEAQINQLEGHQEDIKWSEYLHPPLSMADAVQIQNQSLYCEIKAENHFGINNLNAWHQTQQQQLQAVDIYTGKDFQRIAEALEQI